MERKKTTEQYKKEVYDLVGNEYDVLEDYIGCRTKILMKHNKCGHEYKVTPTIFLKGHRCPYCSGNMKKTTEQYKEEVYNLVGDKYEVLGKYVNTATKILMKHNECGHEYKIFPSHFLSGSRCPYCSGKMKKTTEQFKKEVYDLVGDEYEVLGEYINNSSKILMKHNDCGYEYMITPNGFISSGNRCPYCSGKIKKTTEQFKKEVYDLVGNEYTVIGDYINANTKILMKHNECGHEYMVRPNNFLNNRTKCPYCSGNMKKNSEQYKKEVYDLVGNEYTVLGEYVNTDTKIRMRHNKCGHEYMITPNNFLLVKNKCPYCSVFKIANYDDKTYLFKEKVKELVGDEYTVLGEYVNTDTKIRMRHNKCGHEYEIRPYCFLNGNRCKCYFKESKKNNIKWDDILFKEKVKELVGDEYTVLGNFINTKIKIRMKHNKCGYEYDVLPLSFLGTKSLNYSNGNRCPKCSRKNAKSKYKDIYI